MSVFYPIIGAIQEPTSVALSTTDVTDIYTLGSTETVRIVGIIVANVDASNACGIKLWYTLGSTDYLIYQGDVAAQSTVTEALAHPLHLDGRKGTRKIRAQAEAADDLTVTVIVAGANLDGR